jgi:hypothetical protein
VEAVLSSPVATARLLRELTRLLFSQEQVWNPRWARVVDAADLLLRMTVRWRER